MILFSYVTIEENITRLLFLSVIFTPDNLLNFNCVIDCFFSKEEINVQLIKIYLIFISD